MIKATGMKPENKLMEENVKTHSRPTSSSKGIILFGMVVVSGIFVGLGAWSATAPLARAISAAANLSLKGERKIIQHFEGGIVGSLNVAEGQVVKKGQLLISLNPLQAAANVARHDGQLDQALTREARLESELKGFKSIELSGQLLERIENNENLFKTLEAEQKHLVARRETRNGTIAILNQRIDQLKNEVKGLQIQRESRLEQYEIFKKEIIGLRDLYEKGYFAKTKLLGVERAMSQLRGAAGNDLAQISRAASSQKESQNQIISVRQRFREEVVKELRDVQVEITDLQERLLVAKDVLQRIEIRAPREGIVQGIQFHTVGGVVKPGDTLMEVVPQDDELIVNAQVLPNDIDSLVVGQRAEVRLTALNARTTPTIYGVVVSISGDKMIDSRSNVAFFLTRIEIPSEERSRLGEIKLSAGMPADVLIQTGERTALDYLLKPLLDAFARGLNEE
jgi:HlyD family type I secretion membrane fusion protein